jgi:5'-3' exoribonuclease 2
MKDCRGLERVAETCAPIPISTVQKYIFVRLNVLREYLLNDLKTESWADFNFERALDDWVCLCFFVGNDFLPHLPSLEIRENAIDLLINIYKSTVTSTYVCISVKYLINLYDQPL